MPRQRTAFLVERAADLAGPGVLAADLCCGSGAIALALLARRPDLTVVAADLDPVAVTCAARNLEGRADVHTGDLYDALPTELAGRLGLVTANVPYVPSGDIALLPPEAREHEPRMALDGGADGLDLVARVAEGAATWLAPGGSVLVEVAEQQAESASRAFTRVGLGVVAERDEESRTVVIVGTRRSARSDEDGSRVGHLLERSLGRARGRRPPPGRPGGGP